jgi:ectoine hydroxylase-related dioxygenase (phytanoyl-CoA dioxygenase family)
MSISKSVSSGRTYTDLKRFASFLRSSGKLAGSDLTELHRDALVLDISAKFFGLGYADAFKNFRSNRYFLDSIGIKLLHSPETVTARILERTDLHLSLSLMIEEYEREHMRKPTLSREQLEFLDEKGYLIVPDVVDAKLCDELLSVTLKIDELERTGGTAYLYGQGKMARIYHLVSRHTIYREAALHPLIQEVMLHMFDRPTYHDKYYMTSFHANILDPGCEHQIWHIDANVPDPVPPWIIRSNSNIIVHDYNERSGGTEIIEGSHKWSKKPNAEEAETVKHKVTSIVAPKGSIVFWHGHLWHRSGANRSSSKRVALLGAYAAGFLREVSLEENVFTTTPLNLVENMDERLKSLMGYHHGNKYY